MLQRLSATGQKKRMLDLWRKSNASAIVQPKQVQDWFVLVAVLSESGTSGVSFDGEDEEQ